MWRAATTGRSDGPVVIDHGQMSAVRIEQAAGCVDHFLQDFGGVGHVDDAPRDLVKGAMGDQRAGQLGSLLAKLLLGLTQLFQQVAVVDGGGGVIGQRAQQRQLLLVEGARLAREDAEHAQRLLVGEHRRGGHRAHVGGSDDPVGHRVMGEGRVRSVIVGMERAVRGASADPYMPRPSGRRRSRSICSASSLAMPAS